MHYCRAILTLLLTTGLVWHTKAAELAPVEQRLKENLENRVLIFRETGIEGRHIRFDTSGRLLHRSNNASQRALLFMDLQLHDHRMVIVGEEIQIQMEEGERSYVRDSRRLNLVTCTVDLSGEEPTFPWLIGILARISYSRLSCGATRKCPEVFGGGLFSLSPICTGGVGILLKK